MPCPVHQWGLQLNTWIKAGSRKRKIKDESSFQVTFLEMADRNANLRQSVQNSADYNRRFQENGLHTLDQKKHSGATDAALFADIDNMVDQQKKVERKLKLNKNVLYLESVFGLMCNIVIELNRTQFHIYLKDNNNNMDRLRGDLKREVSSTVKTSQDRAVFQVFIKECGPSLSPIFVAELVGESGQACSCRNNWSPCGDCPNFHGDCN